MATEVYECILTSYLANQFCQTVQHVKLENTASTPSYQAATQIALSLVAGGGGIDLLMACLPVECVASSLRVRRVSAGGGPTAVVLATGFATPVGLRTGHISSAQANPLVIWIGTTAPAKTGRLFLPGVSETDIDEMKLTVGLIADIQDFINGWESGGTVTAGLYVGCIFRRTTLAGDTIAFGRISPLIGTQRRRLHPV